MRTCSRTLHGTELPLHKIPHARFGLAKVVVRRCEQGKHGPAYALHYSHYSLHDFFRCRVPVLTINQT